jgi:hypothetical protein
VDAARRFPWEFAWLGVAGLGLVGLFGLWLRVRSLRLPEPNPPVLRPEASRAGLVVEPPEEVSAPECIAPDLLNRLAEAVGLVLDPEAVPAPDMRLSVEATVRRGGAPCLVLAPPRRVRRLLILWDRTSPCLEQRPVHRQLVDGLVARGIPVGEGLYDRDLGWIYYRGHTQATSVFRASEQESSSIVLVVGEPEALTDPAESLRAVLRFRHLAWIHARDPGAWGGEAWQIACRVPLFAADRQGFSELASWITRGTFDPRPKPRRSSWRPPWQQELCAEVQALGARDLQYLESLLGGSLPWAAVLSACPLPFSPRYAEWVRRNLAQYPAFAAYRPEPSHLDRLRLLCADQGGGWVFDIAVRHCLWWQVLARRWPDLHRAALDLHERALVKLGLDGGSAADLEREAARVLLRWVRLTSPDLCPELDGAAREHELTEVARRLRDLRTKGRSLRWISEWLRAATAPGAFVLPRVQYDRRWSALTRRWLLAAEKGEEPKLWTEVHRTQLVSLGTVCLIGMLGAAASVLRRGQSPTITIAGDARVTDLAWVTR